jgi:hypothetical protein
MKANTSSMLRTRKPLMYLEVKMKKLEMLSSGRNMVVQTRNGPSSMKMTGRRPERKVSTKSSDSRSMSHSTLSQDCQ